MPADWQEISQLAAQKGLTVRAVDLHRYLECEPMPLNEFARAFCDEVAAVDPDPVLLGYSMGGRLALHALLKRPEMYRRAVIVSAHPGLTDEKEKIMRQAGDAEWAAVALRGDWKKFLTKWNSQPVLAGVEPQGRSQLEVRRQAVTRSFMDWSLGKQRDLREEIEGCGTPITWVTGAEDAKFSALAEEVKGVEHRSIAGAGHRVPWDAPEALVELLES